MSACRRAPRCDLRCWSVSGRWVWCSFRRTAVASCSTTEVPRSVVGRAFSTRSRSEGSTRIQPLCSPPQTLLDTEPMLMAAGQRENGRRQRAPLTQMRSAALVLVAARRLEFAGSNRSQTPVAAGLRLSVSIPGQPHASRGEPGGAAGPAVRSGRQGPATGFLPRGRRNPHLTMHHKPASGIDRGRNWMYGCSDDQDDQDDQGDRDDRDELADCTGPGSPPSGALRPGYPAGARPSYAAAACAVRLPVTSPVGVAVRSRSVLRPRGVRRRPGS